MRAFPFNQTMDLNLNSAFQARHPFLGRFSDGWPLNTFNLPANISFRGVDRNFRNPLVSKWNFTIQQDLGWSSALEVSYIGSNGTRQLINWDPNTPRNSPIPNADVNSRRLYPFLRGGISQTSTFGSSVYHGLAAKFEKRYSSGLTMTSSYTWGHAFADTNTTLSGSQGFGLYDITCGFGCEYSTASWDVRHRFVTSFNYDLPFGRGKQLGANMNPVVNAILGGLADQRHPDVLQRAACSRSARRTVLDRLTLAVRMRFPERARWTRLQRAARRINGSM